MIFLFPPSFWVVSVFFNYNYYYKDAFYKCLFPLLLYVRWSLSENLGSQLLEINLWVKVYFCILFSLSTLNLDIFKCIDIGEGWGGGSVAPGWRDRGKGEWGHCPWVVGTVVKGWLGQGWGAGMGCCLMENNLWVSGDANLCYATPPHTMPLLQ